VAFGAEVAELIVALKLDDRGFSGKLNSAARSLRGMDAGLSQMGRGAGQVAGGIARLGTVAAAASVGGLAAIVTTAASFEQAFTGVEKTVDGTEAQLAELEKTLRSMARTGLGSFEELAAIGEAGGALGIARDSLDEFVDVVARLAVSTDLTSESAATALGQLSNVLHLSESDLEDFGDSLVALGNAGASTESQIVEMAARFGAAGNAAGLSKEEILALSSAVASMGIEVEAGGSSLSRVFSNVATAIGTGGEEVQAFTDLLGISAKEFRKRWSEDALGTFQDFLGELSKLDQFGQAKVLEDAGITGVRDINAVRLMAQNFEFLNEQLEIAENATGALGTESDKFLQTTARQWFTLKQNVRDAAAVLGTELLPTVNESMSAFVAWLNQADTQAGIKDFAQDLAAGVKSLAAELKGTDFSGIVGGLKIAAEVAKGAFDAFRALPQPIQQLAIAALVANKVSGGAIGAIATGLGNLVLGSLKTIMAGNVTVIGKSVTGGPTGGGKGGGKLPIIGAGLGAAGLALLLTGSENKSAQQQSDAMKVERGEMTKADYDRLWNHGAVARDISTQRRVFEGSFGTLTRSTGAVQRTAMQQLALQAQALAAARGTTSAVGRLASIPHNVNVDTHVAVNANIGVSVFNQTVYRQRTASNYASESTNTAGF
jgi:TP901 family phage tail tape measure protein